MIQLITVYIDRKVAVIERVLGQTKALPEYIRTL